MIKTGRARGIVIAIALCFICLFRFIPAPGGMTASAMQVLGIFAGVLLLWMTLSIDWPSMLCLAAIAFVPEMSMGSILTASVGNATFSFLMFTFMCTYTLGQTPFIRRCALAFVTGRGAKRGPWAFVTLYFASVLFLGSFMSPTVLVVILLTISEEMFGILGLKKGDPISTMMTAGMVFCAGIAAGMTPIAHVFPVLSMNVYQNATGNAISYVHYMAAGIPTGLAATAAMMLIFRFMLRPDMSKLKTAGVDGLKAKLPPMTRREGLCIGIFFAVVALWVLPALIKPFAPGVAAFIDSFGIAMPPLLGAVLLAVISVDGKPLLNFKDATSKGIPWASLIMVSGTLALGAAMTHADIGLTAWMTERIAPMAANLAPIALVIFFVACSAVMTNFASSMVTATVVATIALPVLVATAGAVSAPAVIALIGMMSAYDFATPPGMATIAFAIGSGWVTTGDMAKYGFTLMVISIAIAAAVGYPIAAMLM